MNTSNSKWHPHREFARRPYPGTQLGGWSLKKLSIEALYGHWICVYLQGAPPNCVSEQADFLHDILNEASDAVMPHRGIVQGRMPVH